MISILLFPYSIYCLAFWLSNQLHFNVNIFDCIVNYYPATNYILPDLTGLSIPTSSYATTDIASSNIEATESSHQQQSSRKERQLQIKFVRSTAENKLNKTQQAALRRKCNQEKPGASLRQITILNGASSNKHIKKSLI